MGKSFWASSKSVAWFFGAVGTYGCVVFARDVMVHEHTSVCGMLMDPQLAHIYQGRVSHGGVQVFISPTTCFGLCALGKSLGRARTRFSSFAWSPCSRLLNVCGHGIPKRPSLRLHPRGCLSNRLHVSLLRVRALRRPRQIMVLQKEDLPSLKLQKVKKLIVF